MVFKIIWSDPAVADLEVICFYIAQDDPETSRLLRKEYLHTSTTLRLSLSFALFIREAQGGHFA